jgi:hypothetical protein
MELNKPTLLVGCQSIESHGDLNKVQTGCEILPAQHGSLQAHRSFPANSFSEKRVDNVGIGAAGAFALTFRSTNLVWNGC